MPQRFVITALTLLALAGAALGQQAQTTPAPSQAEPAPQPRLDDREMMKERLQRRLQETRESEARLERALQLLEQGESTGRVREEAGGPMRRFGPRGDRPDRPDGPRGEPEHGMHPPPDRPGPEMVLRFLDEQNPELAERFRETIRNNPEAAERAMKRLEPHFREIMGERDAEMRGYRIETMRLGWDLLSASRDLTQAIRRDDSEEAAQTRDRIRLLLGEQFDLQVKMHDREIALLERRLEDLRKTVQERTQTRDSFVQEKSAQIDSMAQRFADRDPPEHRRGDDKPPRP